MNPKEAQHLFPLEKILMALDKSMDGVALLNEKGEYYYLNEEHIVMFGYEKAEELLGKTWQHIYGPSEILRINNEIFPLLIKNGHWRGETIGKSKTGIPVLQDISLSFTPDGGIICIARNITDQIQKRNLLQNQEFLLNHSSVMFAILDKSKNFSWANSEFLQKTGLTDETILITSASEIFKDVLDVFPDISLESEKESELPYYDKSGRYYSIAWRISYHPQSSHYFLIGRDNTKVKKQAQLQQITAQINEGYLNQKNRHEYFNKALTDLLRFTESEYGFMGEVFYENNQPYLKTYALTNIAWNEETRSFYENHAPAGLEFKNLDTLFGYAMKHRTVVIANNAPQDHRRGGIPSGHPPLNAFLGIPIFTGNDQMVGLIGLANKSTGYSDEDVRMLSPFTNLFGSIINGYKQENLRREAEQALNETLSEKNAMFRALDTGSLLFITNMHGAIEYVNNPFLEAVEYPKESMIGKNYQELNSGEHDEGFWTDMWATLKQGKTWRGEICNRSMSGQSVWMDMVITPIYDEQANIKQFMSISNLITQRKKLEADILQQYNQLEEKQQQLQLQDEILKNTNSAVITTDVDGNITWVNKAFTNITGYLKEEVIGRKPGDLLQFEKTDKQTIIEFSRALKEKKDFYAELLNRHKNGTEYWIEIKCQPLYNELGIHTGFFAIEEDVTERKTGEEKVKEQKLLLDLAVAGADAGIWEWNMMENKIFYSEGWESQMGFGEDKNWMIRVHPEDKAYVMDQLYSHITGVSETYQAEFRIQNKNNDYVFVLDRGRVISHTSSGKPERMIGVSININDIKKTEENLRQSEAQLHAVIEASGVSLWEWNIVEDRVKAGDDFARLHGYRFFSEMPENYSQQIELVHPEDREKIRVQIEDHFAGHTPMFDQEYRVMHVDTKEYGWLNSKGSIIERDLEGKPIRAAGFVFDIQKRKEAEDALAKARDLAEASVRAKRMFLANMSHEIRTPLHAIMGISDQLFATKLSPEQSEKVQIISDSATSLLGIINDVIELSRIEEGRFKIHPVPFYYRHLVKNAFLLFKSTAENKGLAYELEIDSELNRLVMGDPTRIRQILLNLLSNAVKFTERGRVKLSCKLLKKDNGIEQIGIICSDTGIGMNDEMKKRLFVDFSQEDESFQRKYGGSGLGLAITNQLIKLMNGTIEIESEKSKGTSVSVYLPYQEATEPQLVTAEKEEKDLSLINQKRILVAEDNQFNRLLLEMIFQKNHFSYSMAVNGIEAVERAEAENFDIILMDIQMPEMDGIEAMKKIRQKKNKHQPLILAVTANAIKEELDDYLQNGFDDYLTKPFDESQLLNKMIDVFKNKKGDLSQSV
jgi:PAS domain S-box-containing protein